MQQAQGPGIRSRGRVLLGFFLVLVIAIVGVSAWQLARSQNDNRDTLRDRFATRAPLASSLISSLFDAAFLPVPGTLPAAQYGGAKVATAVLDARIKPSTNLYAEVVDQRGGVLGASSSAPADGGPATLQPFERIALKTGYGLSDVSRAGPDSIVTAVRFTGRDGAPRLLVTAGPLKAYQTFLSGSIAPISPVRAKGGAFVLDSRGRTIAAAGARKDLVRDLTGRLGMATGRYTPKSGGGAQYFSIAPVAHSGWRVAISVDNALLLQPQNTFATRWLPWLILVLTTVALLATLVLVVRVLRARSQVEAANARLGEANSELRRSNADLEQFAYVASHDLSSPLRTVAGFSQLLGTRYRDQLDDEAHKFIGFMEEGVDRMQRIIDDLLSYSRVDQRDLESEPVDLEAVLAELQRSLSAQIEETGALVTGEGLPLVWGERGQIAQVLQNLIANAVTYGQPGVAPRVRVAAEPAGSMWRITVTDNGIGVDAEHSERIFKMFQRLHRREEIPGTGIGLAISRKMVERHGGTLVVEPGPDGVGSTFALTLPSVPGGRISPGKSAIPAKVVD